MVRLCPPRFFPGNSSHGDGVSVRATVALRQAMPPGTVFLVAGTASNNATALMNGVPRVVEIAKTTPPT